MSTILHPVQNHTWWYAAAGVAVIVGLLAVLMTTVFAGSSTSPQSPGGIYQHGTVTHAGRAYAPPCFAGRPGGSIELLRSGCRV
jgi:hypothetical protein